MAVAHDAATERATFTNTPDPATFTHTPSGTPKGAVVWIVHGTVSTDLIDGTVSYGGAALDRIDSAADTLTEPGRSYLYFLGTGIPTGTQTVSIAHNGNTAVKHAGCITVTAAGDTEITVFGKVEENASNPQVALDTGALEALRYCCIYSGLGAATNLTIHAGMTAIHDHDFGAFVARIDRQTNPSSGSFTIGYTAGSDDVAMVAVAIQEIVTQVNAPRVGHYYMTGMQG